jgi:hypothetical protein
MVALGAGAHAAGRHHVHQAGIARHAPGHLQAAPAGRGRARPQDHPVRLRVAAGDAVAERALGGGRGAAAPAQGGQLGAARPRQGADQAGLGGAAQQLASGDGIRGSNGGDPPR